MIYGVESGNEFYVKDSSLTGVQSIEKRNMSGGILWYLKINSPDLLTLYSYNALIGNSPGDNLKDAVDHFNFSIETNMTEADLESEKDSLDLLLFLGGKVLIPKIKAKIQEDEQMSLVERGLKHWWNSWE